MWQVLVVVGIGMSFLGLWFWMQKRLEMAKGQMQEAFKALSLDVLGESSKAFLHLAEMQLGKFQEGAKVDLEGKQKAIEASLEPLKAVMKQLDEQHRELEKRREGAYSALHKQLEMMMASDQELRRETGQLVRALRSPQMRGSWGQVHLRRVVELAGLVNHCDFQEQVSLEANGKAIRPDLVVRLPGQRQIVVDAKTPLEAYLDASETQDESRREARLLDHAASLRKHIKELSGKEYWKAFNLAPEFVILFLPAEAFFSAALQSDPSLIEVGADQNIIVATPTTLIAILRAVAFGWKQEGLSKSAQEIAKLGGELYDRLGTVCEHWKKLGKELSGAVDVYNQSIVSLESRALVSARKLKECNSALKELPELEQIEKTTRA
jgi:DNA recombination protein RmuC